MAIFTHEYQILSVLAEDGGFATGDIAFFVHGERNRSSSALMLRSLQGMRAKGLVSKLDDQKPIAWVRTPAGSEADRRNKEKIAARTRPTASEAEGYDDERSS